MTGLTVLIMLAVLGLGFLAQYAQRRHDREAACKDAEDLVRAFDFDLAPDLNLARIYRRIDRP